MPSTTLKPAVDKLPLAVRKNLRDEWEAKKPGFEKQLADMLGESWKITADANLIYANVTDESYASRLGTVITWYMEPFVENMKRFVDDFGEDGKQELNSTVSNHTVSFGPQDSTNFTYGGLVVENGVLRLVYTTPHCFASNVSDVSMGFAEALKKASASSGGGSAYNLVARNGVKQNYDPKIEEVRKNIEALTGFKGIILNPNFEQNAGVLSKDKDIGDDWNRTLGKASLAYFDALAYQLKRAGFEDDDMLQEGFQEVVTKGEISLQVVEKLTNGTYNNTLIKDGTVVIETTPVTWWSNVDDVGSKILDLL